MSGGRTMAGLSPAPATGARQAGPVRPTEVRVVPGQKPLIARALTGPDSSAHPPTNTGCQGQTHPSTAPAILLNWPWMCILGDTVFVAFSACQHISSYVKWPNDSLPRLKARTCFNFMEMFQNTMPAVVSKKYINQKLGTNA